MTTELVRAPVRDGKAIGTVRVDLKNLDHLHHEGKTEGFTLNVDEPKERQGTGSGPSPLAYFLFGAASCFLNQMVHVADYNKFRIDGVDIVARAHFDRAGSRKFIDFTYDVSLTSPESKEKSIELLNLAEERCYIHQTLKSTLPLTSNLTLNGMRVMSHTVGPNS